MENQKAKEWIEEQDFLWLSVTETERLIKAYEDGAKAETALLSQHIIDLQKDKGNLTDKVRELEQQIEKMRCCGNCKKLKCRFDSKTNINILYCSDSDMKQIEVGFQMCCCKWEIKEK